MKRAFTDRRKRQHEAATTMTLGEGKEKVYQLMDEWSSGGTRTEDADIEAKMAHFFDTAQKHVAQIRHIRRTFTVKRRKKMTEYAMPEDFLKLVGVWHGGARTGRFRWKAGKILIPEGTAGEVEIEYFAMPATIGKETEDSYTFEVSEDAANALPFFVASQQLITDLVIDYAGLYAIYNNMLAQLADTEAKQYGGGTELVNTLFRG